MPTRDCPITVFGGQIARPSLQIKIINPHTDKSYRTYGIIDTGADECAVPGELAPLLGHNLQAGEPKKIQTGGGEITAYRHTTSSEVYHPESEKLLYTIDDTPIDFLLDLNILLLGVNNFLSRFILTVNYPENIFSIEYP